jgi:hypothetical protein
MTRDWGCCLANSRAQIPVPMTILAHVRPGVHQVRASSNIQYSLRRFLERSQTVLTIYQEGAERVLKVKPVLLWL